jgi:hypothetical protein
MVETIYVPKLIKYVPGQFFITKKVPAKKKPVADTDITIQL